MKKVCPVSMALGAVSALALLFVPVVSKQLVKGVNFLRGKMRMETL